MKFIALLTAFVITVMALAGTSLLASQQALAHLVEPDEVSGIQYVDFSDTTGLRFVASARQVGDAVQIAPPEYFKHGALWHTQKQTIADRFETIFQFQITDMGGDPDFPPAGGDGFAFVIQDSSARAIGNDVGSTIGYAGIPRSLAIEFDTWPNDAEHCVGSTTPCDFHDPDGHHISIQARRREANHQDSEYSRGTKLGLAQIKDGRVHTARITYERSRLKVYLDNFSTPVLTEDIELAGTIGANEAWVGFTAATGASWGAFRILSWSFAPYSECTPESCSFSGRITSPSDGASIQGPSMFLTAEAWDNTGSGIDRVAFFVLYNREWHSAGVDTISPYESIWTTPNKLRSQRLLFAIDVTNKNNQTIQTAGGTRRVHFYESAADPSIDENWVPVRAYLNQRSLGVEADSKCSAASMAMVLAMNGVIGVERSVMHDKANDMYSRVSIPGGGGSYLKMHDELERQGMETNSRWYSVGDAWTALKSEIDAGRPVIVRTQHGVVTADGHFIVAVGYREDEAGRSIIAYDPFGEWNGTCCEHNYDFNTPDEASSKGQWVSYDFDRAFGSSNVLLIARPQDTNGQVVLAAAPSTPPDVIRDEPENIGTYLGVPDDVGMELFLPYLAR